jgi:hypothetical protein
LVNSVNIDVKWIGMCISVVNTKVQVRCPVVLSGEIFCERNVQSMIIRCSLGILAGIKRLYISVVQDIKIRRRGNRFPR